MPDSLTTPTKSAQVSLIGDGNGPLVDALRAQAGVVERADASREPLDRIFTGSAVPDPATIESTLDSGAFVALVAPTDDALEALYAVTGTTARPGALALAVRKVDGGFRTLVIGDTEETYTTTSRDSSPTPPQPAPQEPDYEARARALVAGPADVGADPSWVPPAGATWGYSSEQLFSNMNLGCDLINGGAGKTQPFVEAGTVEYYVYYVDGEPVAPYYYVVERITNQLDPGPLFGNNDAVRAWSIAWIRFLGQPPTVAGQSRFGQGLTLASISPEGIQPDTETADVSQQMGLEVDVSGGRGPQAFTASETSTVPITGWTAYDDSTLGTGQTSTVLCQTTPWTLGLDYPPNPTYPPWDQLIDDPAADEASDAGGHTDAVNALPATSTSPLTYYAYRIWRFDASLIDPNGANGRGCQVSFSEERRYIGMLITNRGGSTNWQDTVEWWCMGVDGGLAIDLGAVAVQKG
jgi:hypothetical protein